jgi:hypothetical protein
MNRTFTRAALRCSITVTACVAMLAAGTPALHAQTPTIDDVLARYITAMGGRDAVLARPASRMAGRISVPAMGLEGTLEVVVATPGDMVQRMYIPGMGESLSGLTGGRAWSLDPMQGARLIEGIEAEQLRHAADPTVALRDAAHFAERKVIGTGEYNDAPCVEVQFVLHSGRQMIDCFSTDTGLLVGTKTTIDSPMGSMDVVVRITDYGTFDGITLPTGFVQTMMGIEQRIIVESVEFGAVDAADVAPPNAIRTLLDG